MSKKLFELGVRGEEVDGYIAQLISENFLNEERFAKAYVRGHFYNKKWGKVKIVQELKFRKISTYLINLSLKEINDNDYRNVFNELFELKVKQDKLNLNTQQGKAKVFRYLTQKGFEHDMIYQKMVKF